VVPIELELRKLDLLHVVVVQPHLSLLLMILFLPLLLLLLKPFL